MTYKTVLVILQSHADARRVLDFALPFAGREGSRVIGLHAEALPIALASPMGGPSADFTILMQDESRRRHEELRAFFDERAGAEGVMHEWRGFDSASGDAAISGIESARSADLVIAQQNDPDADSQRVADVEALLFNTGRPLLLVPYTFSGRSEPFKKVLLAWNGSKQAARAAFDALPLMKQAGKIEVLTVDPRDTLEQDAEVAGAAISAALARHGIDVTMRGEQSTGLSHADVIANRLADSGADLLVMGAFGRSRVSEFVFGGVTRSALQSMTVPTFMSH
ncbi:universal stress protein [Chelativorans sp. AA-79]|uniref:universal stress protein n=1 Tax=Chelativorans sp. AA-79 TaxID=3028735 RepID=UPI0023F821DC|nr:universal stress protein [Chelativorans sp. AA-79]WEX11701.1 universal stress protein [Chelativorans sp. AA-79]